MLTTSPALALRYMASMAATVVAPTFTSQPFHSVCALWRQHCTKACKDSGLLAGGWQCWGEGVEQCGEAWGGWCVTWDAQRRCNAMAHKRHRHAEGDVRTKRVRRRQWHLSTDNHSVGTEQLLPTNSPKTLLLVVLEQKAFVDFVGAVVPAQLEVAGFRVCKCVHADGQQQQAQVGETARPRGVAWRDDDVTMT